MLLSALIHTVAAHIFHIYATYCSRSITHRSSEVAGRRKAVINQIWLREHVGLAETTQERGSTL